MSRVRSALILGALAVTAVTSMRGSASAHFVPTPCDKVTSGGFVFKQDGARANFGAHGGCKDSGPDAPFWGHVNYVDHGGAFGQTPYHINSTQITGYLCDPAWPNARDVCGFARTNTGDTVRFRVRLVDNGEGSNAACKDEFGIRLDNGYVVETRPLADGGPGGGNVQLHKPSGGGAPGGDDLCGFLANPGDPSQGNCAPPEGAFSCQ